jgi:hypothetical protein
MKTLKSQLDFTPYSILDIGANHGEWAMNARKEWPESYIMCVEGDRNCNASLKNTGLSYRLTDSAHPIDLDDLFPDDVFDLIKINENQLIKAGELIKRAKALVVLSNDGNESIYKP